MLNTVEVILSGGYSERLGKRLHLCKSEAINDAFRNNILDHNLNVVSRTVL